MLVLQAIFVLILLLLSAFGLLYLYFQYNYTYWKKRNVPYIEPVFPYGNAKDLAEEKFCFGEFGANIYNELRKRTNSFGGFYIFQSKLYLPIDPELIKHVLAKDFNVWHDRGLYCNEEVDPLSAHLVNLSGQKWKKLRSKVTPTFTSGKIKAMFYILQNCGNELVKVMEENAKNGIPFDVQDLTARLTTDNIGSCAFGIDCNSLKNPNAEFRQYGKLIVETTFGDAIWQIIGANFPFIMKLFKIPITNRKVSKFFMDAIKHTVQTREESKIERKDFVDLFIKLKNNQSVEEDGKKLEENLTFNELAAQAFVFFVGGFETSGTSMAFCMYELSVNPDIQEKLRMEIFNVLQKHGNEICYDALMEMPYLDKVISETLRKYPSLPFLNRRANQSYTIPGTDVTIDKGVGAWISVLGIHNDPEYYPEPEKFDPERFSEEEKAKRHPFTYLPFGEGPRVCIGMRFGLLQLKVGLVYLLKNFKFTLNSKTVLPIKLKTKGIMISPRNPIYLDCSKLTE